MSVVFAVIRKQVGFEIYEQTSLDMKIVSFKLTSSTKLLCLQLEFKLDRGTEIAGRKVSEIEKIPFRFRI